MRPQSYFIPPSSHFLKSLINFLLSKDLDLKDPEVSLFYIIFPTKRACFYFKHFLIQKFKDQSFFFPRVLAWEEFLQELYLEVCETPKLLLPETAKIFFLLQALERERLKREFGHILFWGSKFLEVFEEFEKEGRVPPNLLYPPEGLPEPAQALFEDLARTYQRYKELLRERGVLFASQLFTELNTLISERQETLGARIKGLALSGFAALRGAERELWKRLFEVLRDAPIYLFFEGTLPAHPLLKETLSLLSLEEAPLPEEFLENPPSPPELRLFSSPDVESEISMVMESLSEPSGVDQIAILLPQSLTLLPLLHRLEGSDLEVNITLPLQAGILPLYQFFRLLIKVQREKRGNHYPVEDVLKILRFPLVRILLGEEHWEKTLSEITAFLERQKLREISMDELFFNLNLPHQELLTKVWRILFQSLDELDSPEKIKSALLEILEFLRPSFEEGRALQGSPYTLFLKGYLAFIEREVLPLFDYAPLWEGLNFEDKKDFYLRILDFLLSQGRIPLSGEPLAGIQIMGLLEARLLFFDRILLLDVNEGALPPVTSLNPLLTDEIKTYLGLPIFKNELWDYYFEQIISSGREVDLFYIQTSKGKGDLTGEPSRFILKYRWLAEKSGNTLQEEVFKPELKPLTREEGILKSDEDRAVLFTLLERGSLSRSFFETYLICPVQFYFRYVLGLSASEEISLQDKDIGIFLHEFFEKFLGTYQGKEIRFTEVVKKGTWRMLFEELWEKYRFERSLDPLSLWLSEKIARASIDNYFRYLASLEKQEKIKRTFILGVERELKHKGFFNSYEITLWGRIDFIVRRTEEMDRCYIFDFKSNPYKKTAPRIVKNLLEFKPAGTFGKEELMHLQRCFGKELTNFQLLFYLFLLLKNRKNFQDLETPEAVEFNAGYLTPSHFKEPEKFLITDYRYAQRLMGFLEEDFEVLLDYLLTHILESPFFYFTENEDSCRFCNFRSPCQNLRV